ncbi:MAG: M14 family zinc carboxypeptidase, partial [Bacillota bacterium]|nr:M14 family zinc carboxypeptidase [Bacillota bacterium]
MDDMVRKKTLCLVVLLFLFPFQAKAMAVHTNQKYEYKVLVEDLLQLRWKYGKEIRIQPIGSSHAGRKIWAVKLGRGKKNIVIIGSHHGREWITSMLVMNMLETYADAYRRKTCIGPFSTSQLDRVSIWFVPMLNPDGVTIQQNHLRLFPEFQRQWLLKMNGNETDFTRWKANGLGVDLNRQYPSGWKEISETQPSYRFYKGKKPLESDEVKAITDFVEKIKPLTAIAYHSAGREIYWQYHNDENFERDRFLANKIAKLT